MAGRTRIGIFDSGVGGLSVLRALLALSKNEDILFLADQAHVPYGRRPLEEVQAFSFAVTRWLLDQGCAEIIVACNTASAASLHELRDAFPHIPFIGMEPAVKPAAEQTLTGMVGVIATPATFQGALYASVIERFASHVTVLEDTCPGLVEEIEAGHLHGGETRRILEKALLPMLAKGIDTVVLGCTHFPLVIPLIQEITGPQVRVIDPAPAVARQAMRVLSIEHTPPEKPREIHACTTGEANHFRMLVNQFIPTEVTIHSVYWENENCLSPSLL